MSRRVIAKLLSIHYTISGRDLPMPLYGAAVVPNGLTFLIMGGEDFSKQIYSDKVYRYTAEGTWREMPALTLSEAKKYFTAMTVPSSRRLDHHQEDVTHWLNIVLNFLTAIFKKPPVP